MVCTTDRHCGGNLAVLNAEEARKFRFKVQHWPSGGRVGVQIAKCSLQEVVKLGCGVARFGNEFEKFNEISCDCHACELLAKTLVRFVHKHLTQDMQFAAAAARKLNFAIEKQIERPGKTALWASRTFGDGFDQTMRRAEPCHDEARVRQPGLAQKKCGVVSIRDIGS